MKPKSAASVPSSPRRGHRSSSSSPPTVAVDIGDSSRTLEPGTQLGGLPEARLVPFGDGVDPYTWINYIATALGYLRGASRVQAALRLFQGERFSFVAMLRHPPQTWDGFVEVFTRHFIDQAREVPPSIRLVEYAASTSAITTNSMCKLRMLAEDAGIEEAKAVQLILDHLPKGVFPNAKSFWGRRFEDLWRLPTQAELEPLVAHVAQARGPPAGPCYNCGERGHVQRHCPKRQGRQRRPWGPENPRHEEDTCWVQVRRTPDGQFVINSSRPTSNNAEATGSVQINSTYSSSRVHVLVGGTPTEAIVDTGANVVIISGTLARRARLRVKPCTSISVRTASGVDAEITGIAYEVPITLGGVTQCFDAIVMKTTAYEVLLGTNALHAFDATIEFAQRQLVISKPVGKVAVPISFFVGERPKAYVATSEEINIPSFSQVVAPIKIREELDAAQAFHVRTSNKACALYGVVLANGVFEGKNVPEGVLLANMTEVDVKIPAKTIVGEVHICSEKITEPEEIPPERTQDTEANDTREMPNLANMKGGTRQLLEPIIQQYKHLFEEVRPQAAKHGVEHSIRLTEDRPSRQRPYRNSHWENDAMKPEIERLLKEGFIEDSTSPYAAPVILVPKADGKLRMCVDYRRLNAGTIKETYPMPRIDETLDQLHGSKVFSTLDLKSGYWQVPVAEQDRQKTAFITKYGLFQWTCMPFGLCNAPATFQRLMDAVLRGLKWECCLVYLDDVIIYSRSVEEHAEHLKKVFGAIAKAGLKLNASKCKFALHELTYLGHTITEEGIRPDGKNLEAVLKMPNPTNVHEVRVLLGLYGYYRRFIQDFSIKAGPLFSLLRGDTKFEWAKTQQEARDYLSNALTSRPILAFPDFTEPFIVQTDASNTGMGAVLAQIQNGKERVVAFASQALDKAQQNYAATEREALALVWAVQQFRPYIHGRHFKLVTDHNALRYIFEGRTKSSKLARMALTLQEYDFEAVHRRGTANGNADALSRLVQAFSAQASENYRVAKKKLYFGNKVVPTVGEREGILKQYHSTTAHAGKEALLKLLRRTYYWAEMEQDAARVTRTCSICQAHGKQPLKRAQVPIQVEHPFRRIGIDLVGPLPTSRRGNRYVVVATDYFTHYTITAPMQQKSADLVAQFLHRYVNTIYGPPEIIQSDQGREFVNQVIANMLKETKTKQHLSSPYHPMANGLVERTNQSIIAKIAKLANRERNTWDDALYDATFGYNISPQRLLTTSPYEAMFGRMPQVTGQESTETCNLRELHERIKDRINEAKEKIVEEGEQLSQPDDLEEGTVVLIRNRTRTKLAPRWLGPYYVKERGTKGSYFITKVDNAEYTQQIHRDDMRPFLGGDSFEDLVCTEDGAKAGEGVMSAVPGDS